MTRVMFTLDKTSIKKVVLSALCSFNHIVLYGVVFLFVYIKNFLYLCKELKCTGAWVVERVGLQNQFIIVGSNPTPYSNKFYKRYED